MEKTSSGIAANLLDAMSTLVNQAVADASFDKTVEAQIVSYEDSKAGKYKIKYQGEYFYAFSDNTEVVYSKGTTVYVLFPGNSKTAQKTIIGSVKNLGTSYVNVLSESAKYIDIGTTVITNNKEDEQKEYMMLGLRKIEGVNIQKFKNNTLFFCVSDFFQTRR